MKTLKLQQAKDGFWKNDKGQDVPVSYVNKSDKLKERIAYGLAKEAVRIEAILKQFKESIAKSCEDINTAVNADFHLDSESPKGSMTFYNFDRSIKIERKKSDRIAYDDILLGKAKGLLDEFMTENLKGVNSFIVDIVNDAFQTNRGQVDHKKISTLIKHKEKVKDKRFGEAIKLIEQAQHNPDSKTYYAVSVRTEAGDYEAINLNFAAV